MNRRLRQSGTSLVEVLVTALVLGLGVFATAKVQHHLSLAAEGSREQSQALQLAGQQMERLRGFTSLQGPGSYGALSATASPPKVFGQTRYALSRQVTTSEVAPYKSARVAIAWTDRAGTEQALALDTVVAGVSPTLAASMALQRDRLQVRGPLGRAATIPVGAKDLGDGRSIWKPTRQSTIAYVFDNASGDIRARCSSVTQGTADLGAAVANGCEAHDALSLSGLVRLSLATPPDATRANDPPPPLGVLLTLTGSSPATECASEAQRVVSLSTEAGVQRAAVPADATPASLGVEGWTDLGERFVAYHCAVPKTSAGWSGRSEVVAWGWTIGSSAADLRVCRYGDGADHPATYAAVKKSLSEQNFLLVRGDRACPTAGIVTTPHQP